MDGERVDRRVARPTQAEKGAAFRAMHERPGAFVMPNPWDIGTACLLAGLGFRALATTSGGYAFSVGRRDYSVGRDEVIEHVRLIAGATDLPVSADLQNGYGDRPQSAAETIRLAASAGAVGGSIEDSTGDTDKPIADRGAAADRVRAAAEAARSLPFPFTLTGRAENFLWGRPDLGDTIERLQAYQDAGADVLFAPGLTRREDIEAVVRSVDRPVNVIMGSPGVRLNVAELSSIGVKRVSVGSALCRAAFGAFLRAAREVSERGTSTFADNTVNYRDLNAMFDE